MGNQRIYKKYVGQYTELIDLKKWFILFHHVMSCILKETYSESYINEKLDVLQIQYTYRKKSIKFRDYDINILNEYYYDFLEQFSIFENKEYSDFHDLENDKLIMFNIIEAYFTYAKSFSIHKKYIQFFKQSKKKIGQIIPKSKFSKIFSRIIHNLFYYIVCIGIFLSLLTVCFILFTYVFIKMTNIINYLPEPILSFFSDILQENFTSVVLVVVLYLALFCSLIISIIIIIKFDKKIQRILPEKGLAFARDASENEFILSTGTIIISLLALLFSIILAFV